MRHYGTWPITNLSTFLITQADTNEMGFWMNQVALLQIIKNHGLRALKIGTTDDKVHLDTN